MSAREKDEICQECRNQDPERCKECPPLDQEDFRGIDFVTGFEE